MHGALTLLLAAVFGIAGVRKLRFDAGLDANVRDLLGDRAGPVLARALPIGEIGLAAWLVSGFAGAVAAWAAAALLLAFSVALVRLERSGRSADCGCFGAGSAPQATRRPMWRNAVLLSIALGLVAWPRGEAPASAGFGPTMLEATIALGLFLAWYCGATLASEQRR